MDIKKEENALTCGVAAKKPWEISEMTKLEEDKRTINQIVQDNDLVRKFDGLLVFLGRKGVI